MNTITIYIVWDNDADSWLGRPFITSMHLTLEGAVNAVPENVKSMEVPVRENPKSMRKLVKDYRYVSIEEREVGA